MNYLNQGISYKKDAIALITHQIEVLKKVNKIIQENFFTNDLLHGISLHDLAYPFHHKRTSIYKMLEVYGPVIDPHIDRLIEQKLIYLLKESKLWHEFDNPQDDTFYVSELDYLASEIVTNPPFQSYLFNRTRRYKEDRYIKIRRIDLIDDKQRDKYISIALRRLDRIKEEREKLAYFIKSHFDPKHII